MENQSTNQGSGSAKSERPSLAAMAEAMGASLWQQRDASPIVHIEIDSRRIRQGEGTLFVALRSPRRDGMDFVADAYAKGVRNFLLSRPPNPQDCPDANVWVCEDTLSSLQKLATAWRKKFEIPVVAVTGSNGKTVVKEWLFQLLGSHFSVFRNPKSYNSQIGVPLSA